MMNCISKWKAQLPFLVVLNEWDTLIHHTHIEIIHNTLAIELAEISQTLVYCRKLLQSKSTDILLYSSLKRPDFAYSDLS